MAANVSVIGKTSRVRGRVTGSGDVEVRGFVEGEIAVDGDVLVEAQGMVGASIQGRRVVVRGSVKGNLVGAEGVSLEDGARVVGEIRSPRVAIAPGALVRGFVQTGNAPGGAAERAARTQPATRPVVSVSVPKAAAVSGASPVAKVPAPPQASAPAKALPRQTAPPLAAAGHSGWSHTSQASSASPRRPPPPVVPALKKAKGQVAKKKER